MSFIVMGMEMPEYCAECDAEKWDENEYGDEFNHRCGFMYKGYTHKVRDNGRREDCPLRPLPEKHGRLGDIDAIMEEIKNSRMFKGDSLIALMDIVGGARTIVEAEGE